ncbi:glycine receptor subunit alpha-2-like [Branchiostoma floridae]|uniref:Glycine receptor subunit alpha-2-like n=1 Tax=Branchiostoma floridae TaxID=7739 RepID=A0A9J7MUK9_BRAFL|nr:glycine receptor subunit alpha-2-like [Branchiostoma floridae]
MITTKMNTWTYVAIVATTLFVTCGANEELDATYENDEMNFQLPNGYNDRRIPKQRGKSMVDVRCAIFIQSLGGFSEKTMTFEMQFFRLCEWEDHRLANLTEELEFLSEEVKIWKPPVLMMSLAEVDEVQLRPILLTPAGQVIVRHEVRATVHCLMDLHAYPMDTQTCSLFINLVSGNYRFHWGVPSNFDTGSAKSAAILRMPGVHSQLRLEKLEMLAYTNSHIYEDVRCIYQSETCYFNDAEECFRPCPQSEERCYQCDHYYADCSTGIAEDCEITKFNKTNMHVFTTGEIRFTLVRRLRYHLLQTYMPSFFIVFMAWINFWLDMDSPPARVSLGVTTVLTMITQSAQTSRIPEVSYIRAIDVWVSMCQIFVFLALVEYAVVSYIKRWRHIKKAQKPTSSTSTNESKSTEARQQPNNTDVKQQPSATDSGQQPDASDSRQQANAKRQRSGRYYAEAVERVARVVYPTAFLIFIVIYVSVYNQFRI